MGATIRGLDEVKVTRRGPVAQLTLSRPDRLNAVSESLYASLLRAVRQLGREGEVRVLVLTGAGRAFSVGADLKAHGSRAKGEADTSDPDQWRRRYVRLGQLANRALQVCPKPVVAAVNGHAIGGGLELALSCDLVVVAEEAKLRFPEVGLGTFVGGGVTYTLPARVGVARAKELLFLGRFFGGHEAVGLGLANETRPAEEVLERALELAAELSEKAPVSLRLAKRLVNRSTAGARGEALRLEAEGLLECMATRDWREGVAAFAEKRPPRFEGR